MIGRLTGQVAAKQPPEILIDVAGVGYEVQCSLQSCFALGEIGAKASLHTHLIVREDAHLLFGFVTKEERALFRQLIKANGVGPKLALAILSNMTVGQFVQAVHHNDMSTLVKLPGVGKKTAERLLVEMRDKLKDFGADLAVPVLDMAPLTDFEVPASSPKDDALAALLALGYKPAQAESVIKKVAKEGMNSETIIRDALKAML
ncbi:Holliday junction branch migration protein RuvA [Gallaecimonas xiamenensis]|uniref:Holliday junction branch migration complex subunit RuvA n=1 Tax=Gallaecimonas xiamenensis 3-C-1 TaxID=745411 RepID=K2IGP1_9GAMM|nr:Holliday junction branch migration protein RuvA [Gallaecimonas xiamenensis]EKE69241.1 Holliday junction DNA helicase RuvA [Gallaecimonas xiamenensis 3-C-1]